MFRLLRYVSVLNFERGTINKSCLKVKNKQTNKQKFHYDWTLMKYKKEMKLYKHLSTALPPEQ